MIKNFKTKIAQDIFDGIDSRLARKIPSELHSKIRRLFDQINVATKIDTLRVPPGNNLEKLKGNLKDYWSVRANKQWRVIFKWENGEAHDVDVVDYHQETNMLPKKRPPTHPGQMLLKEFLEPAGITQKQFADHLGWTYARLNEIVNGRRGISAKSALSFADAFKMEPEFWLNLQRDWDLWHARVNHKHIKALKKAA